MSNDNEARRVYMALDTDPGQQFGERAQQVATSRPLPAPAASMPPPVPPAPKKAKSE